MFILDSLIYNKKQSCQQLTGFLDPSVKHYGKGKSDNLNLLSLDYFVIIWHALAQAISDNI